jgi:hypothetical protein
MKRRRTDNPMEKREGLISIGHKEKKDRQPNGEKRKGSSDATKRRVFDDPFLFCPLGCLSFFFLWPLMSPFSLVHWVVCPSSHYYL